MSKSFRLCLHKQVLQKFLGLVRYLLSLLVYILNWHFFKMEFLLLIKSTSDQIFIIRIYFNNTEIIIIAFKSFKSCMSSSSLFSFSSNQVFKSAITLEYDTSTELSFSHIYFLFLIYNKNNKKMNYTESIENFYYYYKQLYFCTGIRSKYFRYTITKYCIHSYAYFSPCQFFTHNVSSKVMNHNSDSAKLIFFIAI